jgi:transposase-like protein
MDALEWLRKHLEGDGSDVLREMIKTFAEALMSAEADGLCGAACGQRSPERVTKRNGYRTRDFDTRAGTIELAIPKLRRGSYFPEWLLEPRRRAEQALTQVICQCYVEGVSTRRVDDIVKTLASTASARARCRTWPRASARWWRRSAPVRWTPSPTPMCGSTG